MGIPTYGIRACAQVRDDKGKLSKTVQELLIINLIMSFFAYVFLAIALITVPRLFEDRILYIIISSTILLNVVGMEWLYKGLEKYSYITIRWKIIIATVVSAIASLLVLYLKLDCFFNLIISATIFGTLYLCILLLFKEKMAKEIVVSLYEIFERILKKND